jgi:hypothetical protein
MERSEEEGKAVMENRKEGDKGERKGGGGRAICSSEMWRFLFTSN